MYKMSRNLKKKFDKEHHSLIHVLGYSEHYKELAKHF